MLKLTLEQIDFGCGELRLKGSRKDASCRIDDKGILEELGARPMKNARYQADKS